MAKFKELLVDACIPIAKFRGAEPALQQSQTDRFCDLVEKNPMKITIIEKALQEISNKYNYLRPSIDEYFKMLKARGKFELVPNSVFKKEINNISKLQKNAKRMDFDLSFTDSLQIFYAQRIKVPIISWDWGIIDYCEKAEACAFRPDDFCDYYEKRYC